MQTRRIHTFEVEKRERAFTFSIFSSSWPRTALSPRTVHGDDFSRFALSRLPLASTTTLPTNQTAAVVASADEEEDNPRTKRTCNIQTRLSSSRSCTSSATRLSVQVPADTVSRSIVRDRSPSTPALAPRNRL